MVLTHGYKWPACGQDSKQGGMVCYCKCDTILFITDLFQKFDYAENAPRKQSVLRQLFFSRFIQLATLQKKPNYPCLSTAVAVKCFLCPGIWGEQTSCSDKLAPFIHETATCCSKSYKPFCSFALFPCECDSCCPFYESKFRSHAPGTWWTKHCFTVTMCSYCREAVEWCATETQP